MIRAVIFDLDGVIVSTDEYHYLAWKQLADGLGIPFSRHDNEALRGVSRAESLEIVLSKGSRAYPAEQKAEFMEKKNAFYRLSLQLLGPKDILPGVESFLQVLEARGIAMAIGSSSKNAPLILSKIGYGQRFQAVADGNQISRSKPDPEVFLLAAGLLGERPADCLVVEDAAAGVEAACRAGMRVLGVGPAAVVPPATYAAPSLEGVEVDTVLR